MHRLLCTSIFQISLVLFLPEVGLRNTSLGEDLRKSLNALLGTEEEKIHQFLTLLPFEAQGMRQRSRSLPRLFLRPLPAT